jgi:RNA recognition motif-containing protein
MRGIPYSTNTDDIVKFFDGFGIIEGSVKIGKMPDAKLTGEATVLFATNELAQKAQLSLN